MKVFIKKITLNNGVIVELQEDDIVVFVGPNNVGKSQALSDISELSNSNKNGNYRGLLIRGIEVGFDKTQNIEDLAISEGWAYKDRNGNLFINGDFCINSSISEQIDENGLGLLSSVLIHHSHAGDVNSAYDASNSGFDGEKNHPILFLANNKELREKASKGFRRAYGKDLLPHRLAGASIPLCIGNEDDLNASSTGKAGNDALDSIKEYYDSLPRISQQSDGIKSFVSTLLNLVLKHKQIYLFDEPETFLHPPQIQTLGQIICQYLNGRQAFIATHSQDLIKGLLEADPQKIKIIRITRHENTNQFQILDNSEIKKLWKDSLLKHSDILNGLFFNDTIVCESDADCKMYSVILGDIKSEQNEYLQALFVPSNGKQRIPKIVKPFHAMGIHIIGVFDIDLLKDKDDLKRAIEAFGGEWNSVEKYYRILISQLNQNTTHISRSTFRSDILEILDGSTKKDLSIEEVKLIKSKLDIASKWGSIKRAGKSAIPPGDATKAFNKINEYLKKLDIYIVEVGELECYNKNCGKHGPEWVAEVLERYPDHKSEEYKSIREFVGGWNV